MSMVFSILCLGLFFLVVITVLVVAVVSSSKRKKVINDAALQTGFTAAEPDAELMDRLARVFAPSPLHKVNNLFKKPFGNETYYIFDCQTDNPSHSSDSETTTNSEFGNVGVLSPYLDLPPFMLMPRFPAMPAGLSGILENLISMAALSAGMKEYDLVTPEFSSKYQLFVKEDARNEKVFTNTVLDWIARQEQVVARGVDDFLLYNRYNLRLKSNVEARQLSGLVDDARQMVDFLVTKKS